MNKVYLHHRLARDDYLGRVEADGRVYAARSGPDRYIGRVEPENGKIYASQLGPDHRIGRVELESGKVFLDQAGPDEYLGKVTMEGKLYRHVALAPDEYLGRVDEMLSVAHGGAAFLLLIVPAYDQAQVEDEQSAPDTGAPAEGAAPAGAP